MLTIIGVRPLNKRGLDIVLHPYNNDNNLAVMTFATLCGAGILFAMAGSTIRVKGLLTARRHGWFKFMASTIAAVLWLSTRLTGVMANYAAMVLAINLD